VFFGERRQGKCNKEESFFKTRSSARFSSSSSSSSARGPRSLLINVVLGLQEWYYFIVATFYHIYIIFTNSPYTYACISI
jgi:hypothetical protein